MDHDELPNITRQKVFWASYTDHFPHGEIRNGTAYKSPSFSCPFDPTPLRFRISLRVGATQEDHLDACINSLNRDILLRRVTFKVVTSDGRSTTMEDGSMKETYGGLYVDQGVVHSMEKFCLFEPEKALSFTAEIGMRSDASVGNKQRNVGSINVALNQIDPCFQGFISLIVHIVCA